MFGELLVQFCMNIPWTAKPADFNRRAETDESTPPEIPTITFLLFN